MKKEDLTGKTQDELLKMLGELRREQLNLRFQKSGGQIENTARIQVVRRTIARVKTRLVQLSPGTSPKGDVPKKTEKKTAKKAAPKKAAKKKAAPKKGAKKK